MCALTPRKRLPGKSAVGCAIRAPHDGEGKGNEGTLRQAGDSVLQACSKLICVKTIAEPTTRSR